MVDSIFLIGPEQKLVEMTAHPYDSEDLLQRRSPITRICSRGSRLRGRVPPVALDYSRNGSPRRRGRQRALVARSSVLGSGWHPTLFEVKRSSDSRIRREVIGRMLDYAANAVVYLPVEEIRARFLAGHKDEASADGTLLEFLGEDADARGFWSLVKTNLQAGRIRMIFVADSIPSELKRVVEFLNQQMDPAEVLALELRQYVGGGLRTLVPRVIGNTAIAESKKGEARNASKKWDELSFFDELARRNHSELVAVARALLDWSKGNASWVWWGSGKQSGSFGATIELGHERYYLFAVWTYGKVEIYFQWLKNTSSFANETMRRELLNRINEIPGISLPDDGINRRPSIPLSVLAAGGALSQFTKTLDWMVREIREKTTATSSPNG